MFFAMYQNAGLCREREEKMAFGNMEKSMVSIKALRKSKSMTQKELAQALGISRATVAKYEAGLRTPNMDMIMKLSDVLGCTTDYLLGRTIFPYSELTTLEDKFLGAFFAADRSEQQAVWKILEKYMDL
jgi:transcriptional regulator with XRE-family HTH domain